MASSLSLISVPFSAGMRQWTLYSFLSNLVSGSTSQLYLKSQMGVTNSMKSGFSKFM